MKYLFEDPFSQVDLLGEALSWKGEPFLLNGYARGGVGCAGLLKAVAGTFHPGIAALDLPKATGRYGDQLTLRRMSKFMLEHPEIFEESDPSAPRIGDIVTFETNVGEFHMGLYLGIVNSQPRSILHAAGRYGVSLSNLNDPTYSDELVSCWRILAVVGNQPETRHPKPDTLSVAKP